MAEDHLSDVTFQSLSGTIDSRIISAVQHPKLTTIQAAVLQPAIAGTDIMAQAKTGTGKTVAFLLPAIQRLLNSGKASPGNVSVLIMSPTRELAIQIADEAKSMVSHMQGELGVQHSVGGTNVARELQGLLNRRCDILIATPGRLNDHLENPQFRGRLQSVQTWVLDEADRMLDMGFAPQLDTVRSILPKDRQSLLFSATWPESVRKVAAIKEDAKFINTVPPEEKNVHLHIPQQYAVSSFNDSLSYLAKAILDEKKNNPSGAKIMVFSPTAAETATIAAAFEQIRGIPTDGQVLQLHSRLTQSKREKTMAQFREAKTGILFTSDVSARGVDIPDVSLVIQCGPPASPEQYIHRIGRTGRAGAGGRGLMILAKHEQDYLKKKQMAELPLTEAEALSSADLQTYGQLVKTAFASPSVPQELKEKAYRGLLGQRVSNLFGLDRKGLVSLTNAFFGEVLQYKDSEGNTHPGLPSRAARMMAMTGIPGIRVIPNPPSQARRQPKKEQSKNHS